MIRARLHKLSEMLASCPAYQALRGVSNTAAALLTVDEQIGPGESASRHSLVRYEGELSGSRLVSGVGPAAYRMRASFEIVIPRVRVRARSLYEDYATFVNETDAILDELLSQPDGLQISGFSAGMAYEGEEGELDNTLVRIIKLETE